MYRIQNQASHLVTSHTTGAPPTFLGTLFGGWLIYTKRSFDKYVVSEIILMGLNCYCFLRRIASLSVVDILVYLEICFTYILNPLRCFLYIIALSVDPLNVRAVNERRGSGISKGHISTILKVLEVLNHWTKDTCRGQFTGCLLGFSYRKKSELIFSS